MSGPEVMEAVEAAPPEGWRDRIVGTGEADPKELLPNPKNWRKHPERQRRALSKALDRVGWVQDVIVNKTTGHLVDGHLRVALAQNAGAEAIPVTYVELSEQEEAAAALWLAPRRSYA